MRDSIDFGSMNISTLFRKLLIPTVLGMIFSAVFVITDGIFVGKGIGSDALAAVNITAPLFMITTGIGLMFGMGASVVASIHLSQGKVKVANINITQAIGFASLLILILSALCCLFLEPLAHLLGSSERLLPGVMEYMIWYIPFLVFYLILNAGMFFIRLDGSPNYAMMCNAIAAVTNILLDYIFIFRFGWGLMGAAFATSLGTTSAFVTELSIAFMMFLGNYVFISHLGEDGVAAFSIACYFFPIIFMIYDAIVLSGQPILSYNFGLRDTSRIKQTLRLMYRTALLCGISFFTLTALFRHQIVALFIGPEYAAYQIAVKGLPYFAFGFIFFAVNMIGIGYYQSIERAHRATVITLLRGILFMLVGFLVLPILLDVKGIWLAVPLAEVLTLLLIGSLYLHEKQKQKS